MHALQEVRLLKHGDLLAAAVNGQIEGVSRLHAEHLKEMAELGVPSRRSDLPVRVEAHNHGSVHGYEELLSKAWKDAAYGAVLLVDPTRSGVAEILESSRVAESPLGRVPKQNPDRTISSEGRPINDMRLQNSKGSKFNDPPAPQPRHQSVARQSLWWHARHPGVPQRCAKSSTSIQMAFPAAFRCLRVCGEAGGDHQFCTYASVMTKQLHTQCMLGRKRQSLLRERLTHVHPSSVRAAGGKRVESPQPH